MPVKLTKTFRLKLHNGRSDSLGDGEISGVNLPEGSTMARHRLGVVFVGVEDVGVVASQCTQRSFVKVFADSAIEDVRELGRNRVEDLRVHTKVLR